jgi:hypothetical protein
LKKLNKIFGYGWFGSTVAAVVFAVLLWLKNMKRKVLE